jgi:cytochrome b involved in lipid metabolism
LLKVAGKDATREFQKYHRDAILRRYKERLLIGVVNSEPPAKKGFLRRLFR